MNYYELLKLNSDAKPEQIRTKYLQLTSHWHKTVESNNDSAENISKFIQITKAYSTLIDPIKRAEYDKTLKASSPESDLRKRAALDTPSSSKLKPSSSKASSSTASSSGVFSSKTKTKEKEDGPLKIVLIGEIDARKSTFTQAV